jgi:hypothetical protein
LLDTSGVVVPQRLIADQYVGHVGTDIAHQARQRFAIPAVCAAKPGLLSALDLPLITGKGLVKRASGPSPGSRLVGISG